MERRLANTRKVSLGTFADGWDECYAVVTLADFPTVSEVNGKDIAKMKGIEVLAFEIDVVKKNFISGKVLVLKDDGTSELADMIADDLDTFPNIADILYATVMGVALDPKDTPTAAPSKSESTSDSNTTKTS